MQQKNQNDESQLIYYIILSHDNLFLSYARKNKNTIFVQFSKCND